MKKLSLGALLLGGLVQASGCRVVTCSPGGRFQLTWTISTNDGRDLDCAAADADTVVLISTIANSGPSFTETFLCDDMAATTGDRDLGVYTVEAWLGKDTGEVDDLGDPIIEQRSTEILRVANRAVRERGVDVNLGNFDFDVAISGDSSLSVDHGDPVGSSIDCVALCRR